MSYQNTPGADAVHVGRTALLLTHHIPALDRSQSVLKVLLWQYHCICTRNFCQQLYQSEPADLIFIQTALIIYNVETEERV